MTNIIHFSESDFGGAGSAAFKIHQTLTKNGFKSIFFCRDKKSKDNKVVIIKPRLKIFYYKLVKLIEDRLNFFKKEFYFFDRNRNVINDIRQIDKYIKFHPDIIILHWISGFVDLKVIKQLSKKYQCKVFWQTLDMAPMTGGCHYAWGCKGYIHNCNNCPACSFVYKNFPSNNLKYKKKIIEDIKIEPISTTNWLTQQLTSSKLFKSKKIHEIMLGINSKIFKPLSEQKLKDIKLKYDLPTDKKIIFFGASDLLENRKGFNYFIEALKAIYQNNLINNGSIFILTVGKINSKNIFKDIRFNHKHIEYLNGDNELAEIYQSASIFISPSIEDSGPVMINESIMCGTPVISFQMGVAESLIIDGETGYIVKLKNIRDLANRIEKVINLDDKKLNEMKTKCREIGLEKCSTEIQFHKILKLLKN